MEIRFLGAATTVTGSQHLLATDRAKVLVDCGMFQGGPNETIRNRVPWAFEPSELDAVVLTHAHLDHCGMLPHLVKDGFRGPIFATGGTVELAELVLLDSGKLQEEAARREERWERRNPDRAEREERDEERVFRRAVELAAEQAPGVGELPDAEALLRRGPAEIDAYLDEPLYTEAEARAALPRFRAVQYGEEVEVAPGIHATFVDAGHILGSAIIRLRAADSSGPEQRIVFSGDLGRPTSPILRDPTVVTDADYLLVESTYGGREHAAQIEAIRMLAEVVRLVADHDGVLLVPSFAIGRTQELVWALDRLIETGAIPLLPLYLDSPMASKATEIYRRHAEYFDGPTRKMLAAGETPLDYPLQTITRDARESMEIARAPRPYMIIASNGMLTGGRVVGHLRELIDDPAAVVLFVGYQGEGTLGAHLQAGAKTVRIEGEIREVRCTIRSISGFSAHADEPELLAWVRNFTKGKARGAPGWPKRVFVVHGDPEAQAAIAPKIEALGLSVTIPAWRERVVLT